MYADVNASSTGTMVNAYPKTVQSIIILGYLKRKMFPLFIYSIGMGGDVLK
jgi:hypothetical protein